MAKHKSQYSFSTPAWASCTNITMPVYLAEQEESLPATSYDFHGHAVRIQQDGDVTWFNANDVCAALEYANPRDALSKHVDDDDVAKRDTLRAPDAAKGLTKRDTPRSDGGLQQANLINESGLYSLILGSRLPSAKKFKRWVTSEVLPAIARTGRYGPSPRFSLTHTSATDARWEWKRNQAAQVAQIEAAKPPTPEPAWPPTLHGKPASPTLEPEQSITVLDPATLFSVWLLTNDFPGHLPVTVLEGGWINVRDLLRLVCEVTGTWRGRGVDDWLNKPGSGFSDDPGSPYGLGLMRAAHAVRRQRGDAGVEPPMSGYEAAIELGYIARTYPERGGYSDWLRHDLLRPYIGHQQDARLTEWAELCLDLAARGVFKFDGVYDKSVQALPQ